MKDLTDDFGMAGQSSVSKLSRPNQGIHFSLYQSQKVKLSEMKMAQMYGQQCHIIIGNFS